MAKAKGKTQKAKLKAVRDCVVTFAFCLLPFEFAKACPMCKETLSSPADAQTVSGIVRGYNLSIAALIAVPVALVIGLTWLIARARRY